MSQYCICLMSAGDFDNAVNHVRSLPKGESTITQEQQLQFYANFKQATVGPCSQHGGAQPWAVQFEARAKWDAWNGCKGTASDDAKQQYIDLIESLS